MLPRALRKLWLIALMTLTFINNAGVGGPLPDLVALAGNYAPYVPQTDYLNILFAAQAWGPLTAAFGVPENTPGKLTVLQWGIWENGQWPPCPSVSQLTGDGAPTRLAAPLRLRPARPAGPPPQPREVDLKKADYL